MPEQPASQGRYRLHPLLKIFANEKLGESNTIRQRAVVYYSDFAQRCGKDGYRLLDPDWENIVGALQWADENQLWQTLVEGVQGLTLINLGVVGFMDARGHWSKAREILSWALRGAEALDDEFSKATLLTKLGAFAFRQADFETAERYLQESWSCFDRLPSSADVLLQRAHLYEFKSRLVMETDRQAALAWVRRGLTELGSVETDVAIHQKGNLYILQSTILGRMGHLEEATVAVEKGLALLPQSPTSARIAGLVNLSNLWWDRLGNPEKSIEYLQQGIAIAQELGDLHRLADLWRNMGVAKEQSGHFYEAADYYQRTLRLYEQMGDVNQAGHVHSNLGLNYILRGDDDQALYHLKAAIQVAETRHLIELEAFAKTNLARLQILQGQLDEARTVLARACEICLQLELSELPEVLRSQAEIALLSGDHDAALALIKESLRVAQERGDLLAEGSNRRVEGNLLTAMRHFDRALAAFQASVDILEKRDPYELAKSKLALAQYYLQSQQEDSTAKRLLDESLVVFEALGAKRELALAKGLLERTCLASSGS